MGITPPNTERKPLQLWYNITGFFSYYRNRKLSNFSFAISNEEEHYIPMTQTATPTIPHTLALSLEEFTRSLNGAKSILTIQSYRSDIALFFTWLTETDATANDVQHIYRCHIEDYLAALADKGQTGTTRARKLISLHVFFAFLVEKGILPESTSRSIKRPLRAQKANSIHDPHEL